MVFLEAFSLYISTTSAETINVMPAAPSLNSVSKRLNNDRLLTEFSEGAAGITLIVSALVVDIIISSKAACEILC